MTLCILGVILAQGFWLYRDFRYYKSQPFFSSDYDIFLPAPHAVLSVATAKTMVIDGNQIGANTIIAYPSETASAMMPLQTVPVHTIPALPMTVDFSKPATLSEDTSMFSSRIYPASALVFKSGQTGASFGDTLRYTDRIQS